MKSQDNSKIEELENLNINTTYLRKNAENFSLAPKGQEQDIEFNKCNYYTDRKANISAQYIVHTYSVGTLENTLAKMVLAEDQNITLTRGSGVSVHYVIDMDGTIYPLVPDNKKPWATGVGNLTSKSTLNHNIEAIKNDMNNFCIAIMSINDGKSPLTQKQYESNLKLTSHLVETHHINPEQVIALADWAPGRHIAPGPYFPWGNFAKNGIGLWADIERKKDPEVIVSYKQKPISEEVEHIQQALQELSQKYSTGNNLSEVVKQYCQTSKSFKEEFSAARIKDIDSQLTNGLGMVGIPNEKDYEGHLGSATLSEMLCFNLHHLGEQIINSPLQQVYDQGLWKDSSDSEARGLLGEWNANSQSILDAILDS
ncbi:N-acetylmuramoyl-L-alanine amidase [Candidatus Trichorickettsia mobilis]|uniref:N-acetylmuramoyl-L-alanine amidase n=1 Tax=Candidatus Trichorickettsia mobilis TaxID=1346319 RepID=A0ABZ0UX78_9RICK|nr:N-acetylmuramoyl-L-alanine amidase [Candidatus Trichorickettsia mobilis]WPY00674.1 N-acetylmuramoyl-L-alanine amidase [Candidatus Trichorickettsia mobilis]